MALPSLSMEQVRKIERMIAAWSGKLTWALLVSRIQAELGIKTTRQTLNTYGSIKSAYDVSKQRLRGVPERFTKVTLSEAKQWELIERQRLEIEALKKQVNQFIAFNELIVDKARSQPLLMDLLREIKADHLSDKGGQS